MGIRGTSGTAFHDILACDVPPPPPLHAFKSFLNVRIADAVLQRSDRKKNLELSNFQSNLEINEIGIV